MQAAGWDMYELMNDKENGDNHQIEKMVINLSKRKGKKRYPEAEIEIPIPTFQQITP
jgi:hypothetical protein